MHAARLSLEHSPETIHPMHAYVCASPHVEREILLEGTRNADDRTILSYVEGDREPYEAALAGRPDVLGYDITPDPHGDGFFLYARAEHRPEEADLLAAFDRDTVVVVPPIDFRPDRTMHLTAVGHADELADILDDLSPGISVDVLRVGDYTGAVGVTLTEQQREAVETARRLGYYEVPREGSIEDIAERLDLANSTVSELLRRAEGRLVAETLGERW